MIPNGYGSKISKWRQYHSQQMEKEARYPKGGNTNLAKWRWKQDIQIKAKPISPNGDGSKVRIQMEQGKDPNRGSRYGDGSKV